MLGLLYLGALFSGQMIWKIKIMEITSDLRLLQSPLSDPTNLTGDEILLNLLREGYALFQIVSPLKEVGFIQWWRPSPNYRMGPQ